MKGRAVGDRFTLQPSNRKLLGDIKYQIEVFPHPAIVQLFGLERILKYNSGRIGDRLLELTKLYNYIIDILPTLEPCLDLENNSHFLRLEFLISTCTGAILKAAEDKLDSIICAYVAAYWWYWGEQRNLVLGDETTGYIVIPKRLIARNL